VKAELLPDVLPAARAALRDGRPESEVVEAIRACRLCAPRFALTETAHAPRPVVWFRPGARLLIASQAPGMRAHLSGVPFSDPSGERLREWMGVTEAEFYDRERVAIVPMGFCFPGYDRAGGDIPPPRLCADQWRERALASLPGIRLTLLVGGAAQAWHLGKGGVTDRVRAWREHAPEVFALPHPSWRNTAWLKKNPWFEAEVLPALRARVREVLDGG
jgi:uracil-DNA glycosylase